MSIRHLCWEGTVYGAPMTKKNSSRIIAVRGRPRIIPSKQFLNWQENCGLTIGAPRQIDFPVSCRAVVYRARRTGDACNFYQAVADMLEHYAIVTDDKWIVHWDGSRLLLDADRPRVEMALYTVGPD